MLQLGLKIFGTRVLSHQNHAANMPLITLSDETYEIARRRTAECGFASVEEYIVDLLQRQFDADAQLAESRNEWLRQNEQS